MRAIVVGAGHNGLVCACYLARGGLDVLVLEQADAPGGGARTEATVAEAPALRFDTHSVAHNIINMTSIPAELELEAAGLRYLEMDPFAVAVFQDGRRVRFHRSVGRTIASLEEVDGATARAYAAWMHDALPLVEVLTAGLAVGGTGPASLLAAFGRRLPSAARAVRRRGPLLLARDLAGSYGRLLRDRLASDLARAPVAAFAAHAGAAPDVAGGAVFGLWQAAYHRFGQWHARGGAQGLVDALVARLRSSGGELRCRASVRRIDAPGGRVRAVELEGGERVAADVVVTALDPRAALLELLHPPLSGRLGAELAAAHAGNAVQAVVHVAADRLPPYLHAREGDWNGLQSFVDSLDRLSAGFAAAEARRLPTAPAPAYAFTPSALDPAVAPGGGHTVYLACPAAPFEVHGGWEAAGVPLVEDMLAQVEARAPGFRDSVRGVSVRTPAAMAAELSWPGAHPMVLDVTPDQLGPLRPIPALGGHRTPIAGLYVSGAGTAPTGGVAGAPGRAAARAVLADRRARRRLRAPTGG